MWAAGGELAVFESAWLNDHLTDMNAERPGPSLEAITVLATLVLHALFAPEAAAPPGVTRPDPFYPLDGATNIPPPVRPGGPPIILGGQKPRGIALAARAADGWILPGNVEGNVKYLTERRDELLRAMDKVGRSPDGFRFIGQVHLTRDESSFARAIDLGRAFGAAGATDVIIGVPPVLGPDGVRRAAREVAEPLREAIG